VRIHIKVQRSAFVKNLIFNYYSISMKYLEAVSLVSYAIGGFALIFGIIMNIFLSTLGSFNGNTEFLMTLILFFIFIVAAIITKNMAGSS